MTFNQNMQTDVSVRLDQFKVKMDNYPPSPERGRSFATIRLEPAKGYQTSLTLFLRDANEAAILKYAFDTILGKRGESP